jgi:hypothetical protein
MNYLIIERTNDRWVNTEVKDKFEVVPLERHEVIYANRDLLVYFEASSGNSLATFRLSRPYF